MAEARAVGRKELVNSVRKTASLHEDIKSHQSRLALPYSESKPSEVTEVYWIYAIRKTGTYPPATDRSGKWLIFVHVKDVDEIWAKIKKATEEGELGSSSKVATAKPNPNSADPSRRVICVYTYDWTDREDVQRIGVALSQLGVKGKIYYKTDEDTLSGKYRVSGHTRISKYCMDCQTLDFIVYES